MALYAEKSTIADISRALPKGSLDKLSLLEYLRAKNERDKSKLDLLFVLLFSNTYLLPHWFVGKALISLHSILQSVLHILYRVAACRP